MREERSVYSEGSASARTRTSLALLAISLAVTAFWVIRIAPIEGVPRMSDLLTFHYPMYETFYRAVLQGRLPLWNPHQLTGTPWLAAQQTGAFYPSHVLYLFLDTAVAVAVSTYLHLILVAASAALLLRRVQVGWAAAVFAAVLCSLGSRYPNWVALPNALEASAWLGAGAIAVIGLVRGGGRRDVALLAIATGASLLAGYPQLTVYSIYAWGLLALLLLAFERPARSGLTRSVLGLILGLAVGALLAAAQMLPAIQLAADGTRNLDGLDIQLMYPLGVSPIGEMFRRAVGRWVWIAAVLFPFALLKAPSPQHRALAFTLVIVGLAAVGLTLGPTSPFFDLYGMLPLLDSFRVPSRALFVSDFCFGLVAGLGLHAARLLIVPKLRVPRRLELAAAVLAIGFALALVLSGPALPIRLPYSGEGYTEVYHRPRDTYARVAGGSGRVLLWNPGLFPALPPKVAMAHGMRSVDDYEPLNLRRHAEYFGYLSWGTTEPHKPPYSGQLDLPRSSEAAQEFAGRQRLLDLAAVRFVLAPQNVRLAPAWWVYFRAAGLRRADVQETPLLLLESPRALPRAFVTHRILPAPPAPELLPLLAAPKFDPRRASYVEGDVVLDAGSGAPPMGSPAKITLDQGEVVEIAVDIPAPGLLVLADAYYAPWTASIDGEAAAIHPTNHLFRGVVVPAGRHVIRFAYIDWQFRTGVACTIFAAALVAQLLRSGKARRRADPPPSFH